VVLSQFRGVASQGGLKLIIGRARDKHYRQRKFKCKDLRRKFAYSRNDQKDCIAGV
jgi:hypothetical protein